MYAMVMAMESDRTQMSGVSQSPIKLIGKGQKSKQIEENRSRCEHGCIWEGTLNWAGPLTKPQIKNNYHHNIHLNLKEMW